jgi:hypothetical protein
VRWQRRKSESRVEGKLHHVEANSADSCSDETQRAFDDGRIVKGAGRSKRQQSRTGEKTSFFLQARTTLEACLPRLEAWWTISVCYVSEERRRRRGTALRRPPFASTERMGKRNNDGKTGAKNVYILPPI